MVDPWAWWYEATVASAYDATGTELVVVVTAVRVVSA